MRSRWSVVFRKEFFEIFRDPRTWIGSVLVPLLITPLLLSLVGIMARKQAQEQATTPIAIALIGRERSELVRDAVLGAEKKPLYLRFVDVADRKTAAQGILKHTYRAALVVPEDAETLAAQTRPVPLKLLHDPGNQDSAIAMSRVREFLEQRAKRVVGVRLLEQGLTQQLADPFAVSPEAIPGGSGEGMMMLAIFLPYILSLYAVVGGAGVAIDSIAGEKERGTLETLLVSPVSRRDLVLGKFSAVVAATLLSSILSLVGLVARVSFGLSLFGGSDSAPVHLAPLAVLGMFLVQLPLAVMGAGALLAISTFARNQKEAQTYLMPVMMIGSLGSMMSMFVKADAPLYWAAAPVLNAALVLKQALGGVLDPRFVGLACAASVLYAAIAVLYATRLFQKESVLLKA